MVFLKQIHFAFYFALVLAGLDTPDPAIVEKEYVEHFKNSSHTIEWTIARYLFDFKTQVQICDQMKLFRNPNAKISEALIFPATLVFRNPEYKTRTIDVLGCEIANTKHLPKGREYFYVTKGENENAYFLLTKIADKLDEYQLDRHESVTFVPPPPVDDEFPPIHTIWAPDL